METQSPGSQSVVACGLTRLCQTPPEGLKNARLGLLCNQASLLPDLTPAPEAIARALPGQLKAIFSPQHGLYSDKQDNMVESGHATHPVLDLPVYSLYGDTRRPSPEWFQGIDALLIDLTDVGCRVYTFFTTARYCLEEATRAGVSVWILDRPNPLGRGQEGPILPPDLESFVGPHAVPLRHGLSLGELCRLAAAERGLSVELHVIQADGWDGGSLATTGLPWIMPSPNLPTLDGCLVYPGQVMLEGTTLSEGRGTTRPFEIFGAPGLLPWAVLEAMEPGGLTGCTARPFFFEPTFHKYAGQTCGGFMLHVTDPQAFKPVRTTLALLSALSRAQPGLWDLRPPPYEYELKKRPLDLILGDPKAVDALLTGTTAAELENQWQSGLTDWQMRMDPYLLY